MINKSIASISKGTSKQRREGTYLNNARNRATRLYKEKKVLVYKQNKGYNMKARVIQYIQGVYNQNEASKIAKLASKWIKIY